MGAQIIIDARTRKVRASLDVPSEETTIFAIDLIGDTWDDFTYFTAEAQAEEQAGNWTKRNRFVRSATAALFSHLDGIVSEVFVILRKEMKFALYQPKRPDFCSLKSKIVSIHQFLSAHRGLSIPAPSLDLKLLRDILNHPSVTKEASESGTRATVLLDGADVYNISLDDLQGGSQEIDEWLMAICAKVPYERFRDSKLAIEELARALGSEPKEIQRF